MSRMAKALACAVLLAQPTLSEPAPQLVALTDLQQYSPFSPPSIQSRPMLLFKRQSCPADHTSCTNINAPEACCPTGQVCTHDERGNIACCPNNYYCTGTIGASAAPSTTDTGAATSSGASGSPTGAFVGTVTVTSTAGVTGGTPVTTAPTGSITGAVAGGGSTVPNAYYPFVYMPTSFANAAVCSSYYTSCQAQSTSCFNALAGANGVTIGGVAGGTTQVGSSGIVQQSASSICSTLSLSACYGIQSNQCSTITTASGFVQVNGGPRETGCPVAVYAAAAGVAVGAMGMVV